MAFAPKSTVTRLLSILLLLALAALTLRPVSVCAQESNSDDVQQAPAAFSDSFKSDATSTYTILVDGATRVEHRFTITNLKPTTYLKQYLIKLQFPSLANITATSQGQATQPQITKEGPATSITLNFDDEVVGEGKSRVFTINYTTSDLSVGSGNVLEIRIPALSGAQETSHQVFISVPSRFGEPVRVNPEPSAQTSVGEMLQLRYSTFPKTGISALFGKEQTYELITRYRLKNPSSSLGYTQIALPPDTSFQRMEYEVLDPPPKQMKIDEDGNWIATYDVPASAQLDVNVTARVTVTLEPDPQVPILEPSSQHLAEKQFWQSSADPVKKFAASGQLREIYDSVIDTLSYDTQRVETGDIIKRLGAEEALVTPNNAVCQEYADLLIAGWRAAGIPARRLNGYAFSQNQETRPLSYQGTVLHAWVDYFDQANQQWQMVDPTWEDTTGGVDYFSEFDLNHIVLSINGVSSTDPAPAGSYTENPEEALLEVKVVAASASAQPTFDVSLSPKTVYGLTIPGTYTAKISNSTGRAWYDTQIVFAASPEVTVAPNQHTATFLPFEEKEVPISLISSFKDGWKSTPLTITLQPAGEANAYGIDKENVTAAPAVIKTVATINPSTPLGVIAILSFLTAGSLLVFRRRRKAPLRRQSKKPQEATEQLPPSQEALGTDPPDGSNGGGGPLA